MKFGSIVLVIIAYSLAFTALASDKRPCPTRASGSTESAAGCSLGDVDSHRLDNIKREPQSWLTGGRDAQQSYFSPLQSINKGNVSRLGFAWQYETDVTTGFQATPIVVDGAMFTSGPNGTVYALDAPSGEQLWKFEPPADDRTVGRLMYGKANRGVAVWKGKIFVASFDGYLFALDARTGSVVWKADTINDRSRGYSITGAPYIAKNSVVVGNSGGELDARGYVTAYDTETGSQRWRFFTVPGDPKLGFEHPELKLAAKTWDPNSRWDVGLGGTAWDGMAYDRKLNLLYVGTGNGVPHMRRIRSPSGGDNLFLACILALNADTGALVWHYQTTPGDNWDYTATAKMILADLRIDGKLRQVVMQAPKNGFFYVLDRATGELISAKPYVNVTWASHIDQRTGRPVETEQAEYYDQPKLVAPTTTGGHNWQPMAFNPHTGLVYIPAMEIPAAFARSKNQFVYNKGGYNHSTLTVVSPVSGPWSPQDGEAREILDRLDKRLLPAHAAQGFLRAWDPVRQRLAWEVDTSGEWTDQTFAGWNGGGVMTTAGGLVFQGRGSGELKVYDADSGAVLHQVDVGTSIMAAPMTYSVGGEQYVAVMAGLGGALGRSHLPGTAAFKYGNRGRIVAFKLKGGPVPHYPELDHSVKQLSEPPLKRRGTYQQLETGARLFREHCSTCHLNNGGTGIPDLRRMNAQTHAEFDDIVRKGTRSGRGMASFGGILSAGDSEALHSYLIDQAWQAHQ